MDERARLARPARRRRCAAPGAAGACPCGCASCRARRSASTSARARVSPTRDRAVEHAAVDGQPAVCVPATRWTSSTSNRTLPSAARSAPGVRDLAAALRVERRAVEDDLGARGRPRRAARSRAPPRASRTRSPSRRIATTRPSARRRVVAQELGRRRCGASSALYSERELGGASRGPPSCPPGSASRCSASASSNPARSVRTPYSAASSTVRSIGKPYVSWSRNATSPGRTGASAGSVSAWRPTTRSAEVSGISASSSRPDARLERAVELALLALDDAEDLGPPLREVRVRVGHRVDDDLGRLAQERLGAARAAGRGGPPGGGSGAGRSRGPRSRAGRRRRRGTSPRASGRR